MAEKIRRKWFRNPASIFLGPADHGDSFGPVQHRHDDFETASERELADIEIEEDDHGHHYALRKHPDHTTARRTESVLKYPDYFKSPVLHTED